MPGLIATGHGVWHIENGETTVPPGMRVQFYQEPLHLLADTVGKRLERLEPAALANYSFAAEGGQQCPNYSLEYPRVLDFAVVPADRAPEFVQIIPNEGQVILLSDILADPQYRGHTIYWGACLAVDLKDQGGNFIGVNTGWSQASVPANPGRENPYLSAEQAEAEVRGSELYQESVRKFGNAENVEEGLYLEVLARHASPDGANTQQISAYLAYLTSRRLSSADLATAFTELDTPARRGLLLNDTTRWWLAEHGLHVPSAVTDRVLENKDPRFWDARDRTVPDPDRLVADNKQALHRLRVGDSEGVQISGDVVLIGSEHDDPLLLKQFAPNSHTYGATVQLVMVDNHMHWVVYYCADEVKGTVYEALTAAGADSVWFDAPPKAVFNAGDWAEAQRITAESFERLAPAANLAVVVNDQMAVVADDFAAGSATVVPAIRSRRHVCEGTLVSAGLTSIDNPQYHVSGIGTDCGCWNRLENTVRLAVGNQVTLIPIT